MNDPNTPRYCIGDAAKKLLYEKAHYQDPPYKRCGTCKYYSNRLAYENHDHCLHPDVGATTEFGHETPIVDRCGVCDNYEAVEPEDLGDGVFSIVIY